jgi:Flp pilus assembly protein TadD
MGDGTAALGWFKRAEEKNSKSAILYNLMGMSYQKQKVRDTKNAERCYQLAIKLDPNNA